MEKIQFSGGNYYRAYDVEKRVADMIDARNGAIERLKKHIAELESELLRLREIVAPEDVESIDRVLGESHGGENNDIGDPR